MKAELAACVDPDESAIREEDLAWVLARSNLIEGLYPDVATRRAPGFDIREWRRRNGVKARYVREGVAGLAKMYLEQMRRARSQ